MRIVALVSLLTGLLLLPAPAAAEVRLTIVNGRVTLSARDATVRQILAEWAAVGQTKIVNADRVTGGPVTLELTNVSEVQALDVLLRSTGGYVLAARPTPIPTASRFDRICIAPMSSAPRALAAPQAAPPAAFPQPRINLPHPEADEAVDQEQEPVRPAPGSPAGRPVFTPFPQPANTQPVNPQRGGMPTSYPTPTAPVGVPAPGMLVPVPPAPGQPPRTSDSAPQF